MFEKVTKKMIEDTIENHAQWGEETDRYMKTGYIDLDYRIGGLRRGETYLLSGEVNMGHAAFAMNLIKNIAIDGKKRVAYLSLKDGKEQLIKTFAQIIAEQDQIDFYGLSKKEKLQNLNTAINLIDEAEIFICDLHCLDIYEIYDEMEIFEDSIDLLIVDSLGDIGFELAANKGKELDCKKLDGLKQLARKYNCPIVVLNDLEDLPEGRQDKRPTIEDFNNSKIVRNVDNIIFVYREDYYEKTFENESIAEIIVAQDKHGTSGVVMLFYNDRTKLFRSVE